MCPGCCCPEENWFCCRDNMYCAATAADCYSVAMKEKLVKMADEKQWEGTTCPPGGCFHYPWCERIDDAALQPSSARGNFLRFWRNFFQMAPGVLLLLVKNRRN